MVEQKVKASWNNKTQLESLPWQTHKHKPNPKSKTKTSYKHLHAMQFFFSNAMQKQKKSTKNENDILPTLVVIGVFNLQVSI
jgi:hypothetical protein